MVIYLILCLAAVRPSVNYQGKYLIFKGFIINSIDPFFIPSVVFMSTWISTRRCSRRSPRN